MNEISREEAAKRFANNRKQQAAAVPPEPVEPQPEVAPDVPVADVPVEGPEAWDSKRVQDLQLNWPKAETVRQLGVPLSKEELGKAAHELVDTIRRIGELEDEKKQAADRIRSLILSQERDQNRLIALVERGADEKDVPCVWVFSVRGRDDFGEFITDGNYKTLVRKDTGEVVECRAVTEEDRQMQMEIPDEPEEPTGVLVNAEDDPYTQGRMARAKGESLETCPYAMDDPDENDDYLDWLEGYKFEPVLELQPDEAK